MFVCITGFNVSVIVNPTIDKFTHVYWYSAGFGVTLSCKVIPTPPTDSKFIWNCNGCSFDKKTGQSINVTKLEVTDSGELNCSVDINDVEYTSDVIQLRAIGECV